METAYSAAYRLYRQGSLRAAEEALERILEVCPKHLDSLLLLAQIGGEQDQPEHAERFARRAVDASPDSPLAHFRLGSTLKKRLLHEQAAACFRRALALDSNYADAELELGQTLCEQGDLEEAIQSFRRALRLEPGRALGHFRLGNALLDQGQVAAAKECFRTAIAHQNDYHLAYINLAFAMNYDPASSPAEMYAAHRAWAALYPHTESLACKHANDRNPDRRLRVGYVSGDFREHAVNYSFEPLLARHNHKEFEVFCYSALRESEEDEATVRLKPHAEGWTSIFHLNDRDAAERIRADRIDILIDLGGYTARSRIAVFALKPAPVQATWLGYVNTTGLAAMDYRITDAIVDPEGAQQYNSETLIRLRAPYFCYRPLANPPPVSAPPAAAAGHLTFGSFNNLPKLTPSVIRLWARLLHAIPNSRLIIKAVQMRDAPTADALRSQFAAQGIGPERLDLLAWRVRTVHHLARYALIDIALDPFPFNGVTTTCEALWMGVPVVTLRADRPWGRAGACLLNSVGLPELIAEDPDSYLQKAVGLGSDLSRLTELRVGLRERMRSSLLCDEAGFAREMEKVYRRIWRSWCVEDR